MDEGHHEALVVDDRQAGGVGAPGRNRSSRRGHRRRPRAALLVDAGTPAVDRVTVEDRDHIGRLLPAGHQAQVREGGMLAAHHQVDPVGLVVDETALQAVIEQQELQEHPAHRHRRRHRHLGGAVANGEGRLEVGRVLQEVLGRDQAAEPVQRVHDGAGQAALVEHRPPIGPDLAQRPGQSRQPEALAGRRAVAVAELRDERIVGAGRGPDPVESPREGGVEGEPVVGKRGRRFHQRSERPGPVALPQPPPGVHQARNRDRQRAVAGQGATRDRGGGQGPGHRAGAVERLDAAVGSRDEREAVTAQTAPGQLAHALHRRGGDGRVDRVSSRRQHRRADVGRLPAAGADHSPGGRGPVRQRRPPRLR